jgi:hypothetical protein
MGDSGRDIFKSTTLADKILFFVLVLCAASAVFLVPESIGKRDTVTVSFEGRPLYVLSLKKDAVVTVTGALGRTVVEVKDGAVRIVESECYDRRCVRAGWVRKGSIICLPNHIFVTVGEGGSEEVDAVTG